MISQYEFELCGKIRRDDEELCRLKSNLQVKVLSSHSVGWIIQLAKVRRTKSTGAVAGSK